MRSHWPVVALAAFVSAPKRRRTIARRSRRSGVSTSTASGASPSENAYLRRRPKIRVAAAAESTRADASSRACVPSPAHRLHGLATRHPRRRRDSSPRTIRVAVAAAVRPLRLPLRPSYGRASSGAAISGSSSSAPLAFSSFSEWIDLKRKLTSRPRAYLRFRRHLGRARRRPRPATPCDEAAPRRFPRRRRARRAIGRRRAGGPHTRRRRTSGRRCVAGADAAPPPSPRRARQGRRTASSVYARSTLRSWASVACRSQALPAEQLLTTQRLQELGAPAAAARRARIKV